MRHIKRTESGQIKAVSDLAQAKLIKKVSKEELECCNPLTVASNAVGKLRLCIDLSRKFE